MCQRATLFSPSRLPFVQGSTGHFGAGAAEIKYKAKHVTAKSLCRACNAPE